MSAMIFNTVIKNIIDRCLHNNIISYICHAFDRHIDRRDHACTEDQPVLLHLKMMSSLPPAANCPVPLLRNNGIAKDTMLCPPDQSFLDTGCCFKIHIRNPHRELTFFDIPFIGEGISSVSYPIKIICFHFPSFPLFAVYIMFSYHRLQFFQKPDQHKDSPADQLQTHGDPYACQSKRLCQYPGKRDTHKPETDKIQNAWDHRIPCPAQCT